MKKHWTPAKAAGALLCAAFLLILTVFTLYPVLYAAFGSLKTNMELVLGESFLPREWHFENYAYAFSKLNFFQYFMNSVALCGLCTVLSVVVPFPSWPYSLLPQQTTVRSF